MNKLVIDKSKKTPLPPKRGGNKHVFAFLNIAARSLHQNSTPTCSNGSFPRDSHIFILNTNHLRAHDLHSETADNNGCFRKVTVKQRVYFQHAKCKRNIYTIYVIYLYAVRGA